MIAPAARLADITGRPKFLVILGHQECLCLLLREVYGVVMHAGNDACGNRQADHEQHESFKGRSSGLWVSHDENPPQGSVVILCLDERHIYLGKMELINA
jgi:hypothetical protein